MSLVEKIRYLKHQMDTAIVAHNYASPWFFKLADFIGGTLSSILAPGKLKQKRILMLTTVEMAAISKALFPEKVIIHPNPAAVCTVAQALMNVKEPGWVHINAHPSLIARSYGVFTPEHRPPKGSTITGEASIIEELVSEGYTRAHSFPCPVHHGITADEVQKYLSDGRMLIAHHECNTDVKKLAHKVMSTDEMVRWARENRDKPIAVATETTMASRLRMIGVDAVPTGVHVCWAFKSLTPELVLWAIKNGRWKVEVPPTTSRAVKARFERLIRELER